MSRLSLNISNMLIWPFKILFILIYYVFKLSDDKIPLGEPVVFFHMPSLTQSTSQAYKIPSRITKEEGKKISVIEHCVVTTIVGVGTVLQKRITCVSSIVHLHEPVVAQLKLNNFQSLKCQNLMIQSFREWNLQRAKEKEVSQTDSTFSEILVVIEMVVTCRNVRVWCCSLGR